MSREQFDKLYDEIKGNRLGHSDILPVDENGIANYQSLMFHEPDIACPKCGAHISHDEIIEWTDADVYNDFTDSKLQRRIVDNVDADCAGVYSSVMCPNTECGVEIQIRPVTVWVGVMEVE